MTDLVASLLATFKNILLLAASECYLENSTAESHEAAFVAPSPQE